MQALAASGLRALRYAREVDGIGQVIALDNDKGALTLFFLLLFIFMYFLSATPNNSRKFLLTASVEACKKNIQFNGSLACSKVEAHLADARVYMLTHPKEFDVVTLCSVTEIEINR